jgi:hypothetical protein
LKLNPNLLNLLCWWRIRTLIWKIIGESSWFYMLGFRFQFFCWIFSKFSLRFTVYFQFWAFDDDLKWKTRRFCEFTWRFEWEDDETFGESSLSFWWMICCCWTGDVLLLLLHWFDSASSIPLLLHCDRTSSLSLYLNCSFSVRWWRFEFESLRTSWILLRFGSICDYGNS